jgi:hypothetical protein
VDALTAPTSNTYHFHRLHLRSARHYKLLARNEKSGAIEHCRTTEIFRGIAQENRQKYLSYPADIEREKAGLAEAFEKIWDELDARSRRHGLSEGNTHALAAKKKGRGETKKLHLEFHSQTKGR